MECAMMKLIMLNAYMMEATVVELVSIQTFVQSAYVMKKLIPQLILLVCIKNLTHINFHNHISNRKFIS